MNRNHVRLMACLLPLVLAGLLLACDIDLSGSDDESSSATVPPARATGRALDSGPVEPAVPSAISTGSGTGIPVPSSGKIYHAVYPGGTSGEEDDLTLADLRSYEQHVGKTAVWVYFSHNWYQARLGGRRFPLTTTTWIRDAGSIPYVRLMMRSSEEQGLAEPTFTLDRIISGDFDSDLRAWARDARDFASPLIVEYGTEVNGEWFSWNGIWNGGGTKNGYGDPNEYDGPERFRDAYRHIIQIARDEGASNITWVFHVDSQDVPDEGWNRLENYYPGNAWIDWIGVSVYGALDPQDPECSSLREGLDEVYPRLAALSPDKPIALLEFGVTSGNSLCDQHTWAEAALADLIALRWPRVIGFSWWNEKWENDENPSHDTNMRVQDNPALDAVFQAWVGGNDNVLGRPEAQGDTYYVATDSSADDGNPGTLAQPWRTIQKAASTVQAGDTVYVRGGIYAERVTINVSGSAGGGYIAFRNYPGETPIVDGTGLSVPDGDNGLFLIADQSYLIIEGFEIRNYSTSTLDRVPVGINVRGAAHHVQLRNNHIHHIETHAAPSGPDLLGADAHGIAVYGTSAPTSTHHIAIDGNKLDHLILGSSEALALNGNVEVFTVTHNVVHDNDNIGIDCIGFEGTSPNPAYDQARDGVVVSNTIYNIDTLNNPSYGRERGAGGIYVDGGKDILVERNTVHSSNIGIELASEHQGKATSQITVRSNLVFNNHMAGIAMGGYDTERGSTENCTIVNNTLYNNDTLADGNGEIQLNYDTRSNVIQNNIIYANSQSLLIGNTYAQNTGNTLDYNAFYAPAGSEGSEWEWKGVTYTGWAAYKVGSGNDTNSMFTDPELVDVVSLDLHLQSTSPAIDAGENLATVGDYDIDGQARIQGGRVDIGADEYLTSTIDVAAPG